tara:strand:- start:4347 stop:5261 length:915 start_codon:yes stop_codon:yes gene_type:complete
LQAHAVTEARWHVLGGGAIGCLFADYLSAGGCELTVITREGADHAPVSVERVGPGGPERRQLPVAFSTAGACGPISHLLISTKAYDVVPALAGVSHCLGDTVALLMVNGMGIAEVLAQEYPQLAVFCATTTEGAYRRDRYHVQHAGRGETRIGGRRLAQPPPWFGQWARSVPECHWESDIEAALWGKLAVNCVINPLTALYGCPNGALAERPELARQVERLCREVSQVSYAAGFTRTARTIGQSVAQVIANTAENRSSMLQDVEAGRPTEIDYISGYLLETARQHGVPARHNRELMQKVKQLAH